MTRLDKMLAEMGVGTRSQIKEMAKRGRIQVNGATEKKADRKVDPEKDLIAVDRTPVSYVELEYYMLNKPQGVVSATEDNVHETVMDLLRKGPDGPKRKDLFPVGRLDIDTEGLLLITNDGEMAHGLLSPRRHVDKRYYAKVEGELPSDAGRRLEQGITLLDGTPALPAKLELLDGCEEAGGGADSGEGAGGGTDSGRETEADIRRVALTIHEGKFHQVKRMFEALGCRVVFLKRLSMGSLVLDGELRPGEYRPLTDEEVQGLRRCAFAGEGLRNRGTGCAPAPYRD